MSNKELIGKATFDVTTRCLAFSPDGSHLSVGHGDGSFRVLKGRFVFFIVIEQDPT